MVKKYSAPGLQKRHQERTSVCDHLLVYCIIALAISLNLRCKQETALKKYPPSEPQHDSILFVEPNS